MTDANFDTDSYQQFAEGYFLRRDACGGSGTSTRPTPPSGRRSRRHRCGPPPSSSPDFRRGEAYAAKLRQAGVPVLAVRYQGIVHDFVMLNTLRNTPQADAAITLASSTLRARAGLNYRPKSCVQYDPSAV